MSCGTLTAYTPPTQYSAGSVTLNGAQTYPVAAGTVFSIPINVGGYYCFLFNSLANITGCLSSIPTGLVAFAGDHRSFMLAE